VLNHYLRALAGTIAHFATSPTNCDGYRSDLTDQVWELIEPLLSPVKTVGRRKKSTRGRRS
jgi:hypothetical protein